MHERAAAQGDGFAVAGKGKVIVVAMVVGKRESHDMGGIPQLAGKPAFGFPAVFSTSFLAPAARQLNARAMMAARYYDLIRETKPKPYNHRLGLVESARERGMTPGARLFATTVPTVRK